MAPIPAELMSATAEALRRHAPYDRMDKDTLEYLVPRLSLAYFPKGAPVTGPDDGQAKSLCIIQRGHVRGEVPGGADARDLVEYSSGDTFPLAAIMAKRAVRHAYVAHEDTFCYQADAAIVDELVRRSPEFHAFCTDRVKTLLQQSYELLQTSYAKQGSAGQTLNILLKDVLRREPLRCAPDDPLREALRSMQGAKLGSIVVVDPDGAPLGIFTERDLLRLAAASEFDPGQPIRNCMTSPVHTLPPQATAAEAAVLMAKFGIRHVIVEQEGRLAGVVSERDLFSLQRTSMRGIVQSIESAGTASDLVHAAGEIRSLAGNLFAQGVAAEQLIRLIATLNDRLTGRILSMEAQHHALAGVRVCWISLGSEGRLEQTFATDQDNGIVFSADGLSSDQARLRLLPFARAVNDTLDQCGFPLCKGNIMAGNPDWCLHIDEWRTTFSAWIRNPLPQALLHSNIFYDFRHVWGDAKLALELRDWLAGELTGNQRFLRAMALNAMEARPPLGLFADFVTSGKGEERNTIDLKAEGTRPFVDAARILALAGGITLTNTAERLRRAGEQLRTPREETEGMVDAFHFIQLLRLRHQQLPAQQDAHPNRIDPDALNELDRRILKEAFRQARRLQQRLALDYQL